VIEPHELLVSVHIETPTSLDRRRVHKTWRPKDLGNSMVNVATLLTLESPDGPIVDARIALGAVAPTPVRAYAAEQVLIGERTFW